MAEPRGYLVVPVGFNPSGDIRALELDADDAVLMAIESAAKGLVGPHGWIDGAWQKSPLPFGYSGQAKVSWGSTDLPAGASNLDSSPVPAGEVWVITQLSMVYYGTAPSRILMRVVISGDPYTIWQESSPASAVYYDHQGWWVLAEGDKCRLYVEGATAGDDVYGYALGFRVDVDQ